MVIYRHYGHWGIMVIYRHYGHWGHYGHYGHWGIMVIGVIGALWSFIVIMVIGAFIVIFISCSFGGGGGEAFLPVMVLA
jgi:hypothetical protein